MTNIAKAINAFLKEKNPDISEFDVIYNDIFPDDDTEGLISRHDPSQARVVSYLDGTCEGSLSLAYYCRNQNAKSCRQILTTLIETLDDAEIEDSDGLEVYITATTEPQFVEIDDKGCCIYTCSINADYLRN